LKLVAHARPIFVQEQVSQGLQGWNSSNQRYAKDQTAKCWMDAAGCSIANCDCDMTKESHPTQVKIPKHVATPGSAITTVMATKPTPKRINISCVPAFRPRVHNRVGICHKKHLERRDGCSLELTSEPSV
jgi:hypothetical protein